MEWLPKGGHSFMFSHVMNNNYTFFIFLFLYIVLFPLLSYSQTPGESIIEQFIKENDKLTSIDCSLEQIIYENNTIEKYKGRYRSDKKGRFRIDYNEPFAQTVISTGKNILWYIPASEILYVIQNGPADAGNLKKLYPKLSGGIEKSLSHRYLGMWPCGFFTLAHRFLFIDVKNGLKLDMAIAVKDLRLLEKRIRDRDGKEIMKEIYSDYHTIGQVLLPGRVDVYAKTKNGYVRSISFYSDIRLNIPIADEVFKMRIPKKTRVLSYGRQ